MVQNWIRIRSTVDDFCFKFWEIYKNWKKTYPTNVGRIALEGIVGARI